MQMKCRVREAAMLILYTGQLLHSNKPLLVSGEAISEKESSRNPTQLDSDLQYADNCLLYSNKKLNGTRCTNSTSEIILHHNRNPRSIKTHRRKKRKNERTKKSKRKSEVKAHSLEMKLNPAVNGDANTSNKEDLTERASFNLPAKAMHDVGKKIGNHMGGSSQIGDRKSHTVIKPTVVVNYHGAVKYGRNKGKYGKSRNADRKLDPVGENIIHINQEINFGPPHGVISVERLGMKNKTKEYIKKYLPKENFYVN